MPYRYLMIWCANTFKCYLQIIITGYDICYDMQILGCYSYLQIMPYPVPIDSQIYILLCATTCSVCVTCRWYLYNMLCADYAKPYDVQLLHAYYNSLFLVFPSCRLCWSAGSLTPTSGQPSSSWPTCSRISTSPHSPSTWSRTVSQSWLNLQRCTYTREEKTMVWGGSILIRFR